jgi:fused signal recognition particle receptor
MSFFKKLKDRLTRSSSKLEEGLDAIVDAGADDAVEARPVHEPLPDPVPGARCRHLPRAVPLTMTCWSSWRNC